MYTAAVSSGCNKISSPILRRSYGDRLSFRKTHVSLKYSKYSKHKSWKLDEVDMAMLVKQGKKYSIQMIKSLACTFCDMIHKKV